MLRIFFVRGRIQEVIQYPAGFAGQVRPHRRFLAEEIEKRKRLVQPRQALEGWQMKSFFDFN